MTLLSLSLSVLTMRRYVSIIFLHVLFLCSSSPIKLVLDRLESWKLRNEEDAAEGEGEGAGKKGAGEQQPGPKEQASPPHSPVKSADLPVQYVGAFEKQIPSLRY